VTQEDRGDTGALSEPGRTRFRRGEIDFRETSVVEIAAVSLVRVFVSFDVDQDEELLERLHCESARSGFTIVGCSESSSPSQVERLLNQVGQVDQMILICGEHTESSVTMSAELHMAQEAKIPYLLLWGRRDRMCTKPIGAKTDDGIYNWTLPILRDQVACVSRKARSTEEAESLRRTSRSA